MAARIRNRHPPRRAEAHARADLALVVPPAPPPDAPEPLLSDLWNQWKQAYPDEERKRPLTRVWQPRHRRRVAERPLEKGWSDKVDTGRRSA